MAYISRERKTQDAGTNVEIDLDGGPPRERRRRVRVLALLLALAHVIQEGVSLRFFFLGLLQVAVERHRQHVGGLQRY